MRGVRLITALTGLFLLVASSARAQASAKEEFEVASVKPFIPNPNGWTSRTEGGPGTSDPSRIRYLNLTFKSLLATAYGVENFMISGPAWLDSGERWIIDATIRQGATKEQVNQMLQNLLTDRFKMTLHRETRTAPLYELTVVKKGSQLREFVENAPAPADGKLSTTEKDGFVRIRPGPLPVEFVGEGITHVWGRGETVSELVNFLSSELKARVVDQTGLTGKYDYNLEFSEAPSTAPDFVAALRDQLGLKLESKQGPVDLLVIDHVEKTPTAN
jgi:uncharacterized protein (TIGR03435 family)